MCNLEYGNLRLNLTNYGPPFSPDVALPRLRQLLINCETEFSGQLFQGLTFPALTGFRLRQHTPMHELYRVLRKQKCL
jgi:hypothetical protein